MAVKKHRRKSGAGRRVRFALYAAAIWVSLTVVTEVVLRLCGMGPEPARELPKRYSKFVPDEDLIWVLKSDWDGFEPNNVPVHHNSFGLRGPEPAPARDRHARILFIGDSVTFGHFLPYSVTVPHLLQQNLSDGNGRAVEVINAGVPGYSTFQEAGLLRRHGNALKPDLVLLGFCMNDVTERYTALAAFGGSSYFMIDVDTTVGMSLIRRLWWFSAIRNAGVKLLRASAERDAATRLAELFTAPATQPVRDDWQVVYDELDQFADEARAIGARLAVVIYPVRPQMEFETGFNAGQQSLIHHLEKRTIPFIDLLEPLRSAQGDGVFQDLTHLSEQGSRIAAAEIARFIEDNGLLGGH